MKTNPPNNNLTSAIPMQAFLDQRPRKSSRVRRSLKDALFALCFIGFFALILSFNANAAASELDDSNGVNSNPEQQRLLIANKLKATFVKTTFTNLEPSPIKGMWQAEISNQVVYFHAEQELIFFGDIYDKNGISLSEQTRQKWQAKRTAKLDVTSALVIGSGPIEIIEFSDPDCPFCLRFGLWVEQKNSEFRASNNGKDLFTRKVIMTPIDSLHPNAHKEAVHVLCVAEEESNKLASQALLDVLKGTISYVDMLGCDEGKKRLLQHRTTAEKFGISATPTLVIDGQIVQGFNEAKLDQLVQSELARIKKPNDTKSLNNKNKGVIQ